MSRFPKWISGWRRFKTDNSLKSAKKKQSSWIPQQAIKIPWFGRRPPRVSTTLDAPKLSIVTYDGNATQVTWKPVDGSGLTYGATVYSLDGSFSANSPMTSSNTTEVPGELDPAKKYNVEVQVYEGRTPGPKSSPVNVMVVSTQLSALSYDGEKSEVIGKRLRNRGVQYVATVYSTDGSESYNSDPTEDARCTIEQKLDSSKTYKAVIAVVNGISSGPNSDVLEVITEAPTLNDLEYDLSQTTLKWDAVSGTDITYGATLYATDGSSSENPPPTADLQISIPKVLDPSKTYRTQVQAIQGNSKGPMSDPVQVLTGQPEFNELYYDLNATLLKWSVVSGTGIEYEATLHATDGSSSENPPPTPHTQISIHKVLDDSKTYQAQVRAVDGIAKGPYSTAVTVVTEQPVLNDLEYDLSATTMKWNKATTKKAEFAANMHSTDGSVSENPPPTPDLQIAIPLVLDPTKTYLAQVQILVGISRGPYSNSAAVITGQAQLNDLEYDLTQTTLKWDEVGGTGTEYAGLLYATDGSSSKNPPPTTELEIAIPEVLDDSKTYKAQVQVVDGISKGPKSTAVEVITAQPVPNDLDYDGNVTVLKWNALSGTGIEYGAHLYSTDGSVSQNAPLTTDLEANFPDELDASKTFKAQVHAVAGISKGPYSTAVQVITAKPVLNDLEYNLTSTTLKWDAVSGTDVEYAAHLYSTDGGGSENPPLTKDLQITIPKVLESTKTYKAQVQATEGISKGPFSDPVEVITLQPDVNALTYDLNVTVLKWDAVSLSGIEYGANLHSTDGSVSENPPPTTNLEENFPNELDPKKTYKAQVQVINGISKGPYSTAIQVITEQPELNDLEYNLSATTLKWDAVSGTNINYGATLYATDGSESENPPPTTDLQIEIPKVLNDSKTYKAQVQVIDGVSQGPFSTAVEVITEQAQLNDLEYNLTDTTLKWDAVSQTGVEYAATLYATDGSGADYPPPTSDLQISIPKVLDGSKTYKAEVQAVKEISKGPSSTAVAVITAQPQLNDLEYNLTDTTLKWNAVSGTDINYAAHLYSTDGSTSENPPATTDLEITIPKVLEDSKTYQAQVQVVNGISKGPNSTAVDVITEQAQLNDLEYNASETLIKWDAATIDSPQYVATLVATDGSYSKSSDPSTNLQASFTKELDTSKTYQGSARVVKGISKGPESAAVDVITSLPSGVGVNYNGTKILSAWQVDSAPGITGYLATLYADGGTPQEQTVSGTSADFTQTLNPGVIYTVLVRSVAGISKGPFTPTAFAPFAMNSTLTYDGQGQLATKVEDGQWTYTYTLDKPGNIKQVDVSKQ